MELNLKELYETNEDFHNYVKKYIRNNGKTIEQALREKLVKEVALLYLEDGAHETVKR